METLQDLPMGKRQILYFHLPSLVETSTQGLFGFLVNQGLIFVFFVVVVLGFLVVNQSLSGFLVLKLRKALKLFGLTVPFTMLLLTIADRDPGSGVVVVNFGFLLVDDQVVNGCFLKPIS